MRKHCQIGFAVLDKRHANVLGAVVGAVFVGIVLNGLTMLNVPYYSQDFVKGIVLVGGVTARAGRVSRRRAGRSTDRRRR